MADMKEGWRNYIRTTQGMIIVAQIVSKKNETEILYNVKSMVK